MKTYKQLQERINMAKAKMGDVIKDFQASDAPQFKGKSQEKRRQMAIAAKMAAEEVELEEGRMKEIAMDMETLGDKEFKAKHKKSKQDMQSALKSEELKGDQHKIDANKNGKIDGHDFKLLRGKKVEEEVEQIDEISDKMKARYLDKAVKQRHDFFTKPWDPKENPKWATPGGKPKKGYYDQPHKVKAREKDARRGEIIDKTAEKLTGKPHYSQMSTKDKPAVHGNADAWWKGRSPWNRFARRYGCCSRKASRFCDVRCASSGP